MDQHTHLRTCYPYDELEALIAVVLQDGKIDNDEHRVLLRFLSEFIEYPGHRALELQIDAESALITGICARCPEIVFESRVFCFTGKSKRHSRQHLVDLVERKGGRFHKSVVMELDYLVIGADGNPCWAFACYGRKVETAIGYRKQGCKIVMVHEDDFWEAVESL